MNRVARRMEFDTDQVLRWRRILELTETRSCLDLDAGTDALPPRIVTNLVERGAMASAAARRAVSRLTALYCRSRPSVNKGQTWQIDHHKDMGLRCCELTSAGLGEGN